MDVATKLRKWSREEYEDLVEGGVFGEDERLELVEGEILEMTPQDSRHASAVYLVHEALRSTVRDGHIVRSQLPLALAIVEVADSSLPFDRGRKPALYARESVPELWIVNLADSVVEVHREPAEGRYRERRILSVEEEVESSVVVEAIPVASLLP